MALLRALVIAVVVLLAAGGLLAFTDVPALDAAGGLVLGTLGVLLLLALVVALALGVRALLFRRREPRRGGRLT